MLTLLCHPQQTRCGGSSIDPTRCSVEAKNKSVKESKQSFKRSSTTFSDHQIPQDPTLERVSFVTTDIFCTVCKPFLILLLTLVHYGWDMSWSFWYYGWDVFHLIRSGCHCWHIRSTCCKVVWSHCTVDSETVKFCSRLLHVCIVCAVVVPVLVLFGSGFAKLQHGSAFVHQFDMLLCCTGAH